MANKINKPKFQVVSIGGWLADDRVNKTCSTCKCYTSLSLGFVCGHNDKVFGMTDSPYHITCKDWAKNNETV